MGENLFKRIQDFVDLMDKSRRQLLKLEKERQKKAAKRAKEREKLKKQKAKEMKNGNPSGTKDKVKFDVASALQKKKDAMDETLDKGNLLFHGIQQEAARRRQLQDKLATRLTTHFKEVQAMSKGKQLPSMAN